MSTITGGAGADRLRGTDSADQITGLSGNDTLEGGAGDDELRGGDGDDLLSDSGGNDLFDGGAGNDVIVARPEAEWPGPQERSITIEAGDGNDVVTVDAPANIRIDLGAGDDRLYLDELHRSAVIALGAGSDRVELGEFYVSTASEGTAPPMVVSDFAAGGSGDILDLGLALVRTTWNRHDNPFATGHLRLLQQGADVIVGIDYDGAGGSDRLTEVFRLEGVQEATLSAFNFAGFDPAPAHAAPVQLSITGTAGADSIFAAAGGNWLDGLDGSDVLQGSLGNDSLIGGAGNDTIEGGYGNDWIAGGADNDLLQDLHGGSDTLAGGDGDDHFVVLHQHLPDYPDATTIDAAGGDDAVEFFTGNRGALVASLGDGNDRITVRSWPSLALLTLGNGRDVLVIDPQLAVEVPGSMVVTDFTPGDAGDRIDWLDYARALVGAQGADFNPFSAGVARLEQSGADTVLVVDGRGRTFPLVVFSNTAVSSFTQSNFGVDTHASPPVLPTPTHNGTTGADSLAGGAGNDWMRGLEGNDTLAGQEGDDTLEGGPAPDLVLGGDGNDAIADPYGTDFIVAGPGNDTISVWVEGSPLYGPIGSVQTGEDNDLLGIRYVGSASPYLADLGSGDDHVVVAGIASDLRLTLGSGRDLIELPAYFSNVNSSRIVVGDFQAGAGGDVVDVRGFFGSATLPFRWPAEDNPFQLGYLELRQVGSDADLLFHPYADSGATTMLRFTNSTVDQFDASNFGGYDPHVVPNTAHVIDSSLAIAPGQIDLALNTTPIGLLWQPHYIYSSETAEFVNHGIVVTEATVPRGITALAGLVVSHGSGMSRFVNAADGNFVVHGSGAHAVGVAALTADLSIVNDGRFEVISDTGTAEGVVTGYDSENRFSSVNNGGLTVLAHRDAWGVVLGFGGSFENNGNVTVEGGEFAVGVYSGQYSGQPIVNNGTMTVATSPSSPYASVGVLLPELGAPYAGAYHHWNAGTITADYAYYVYEFNGGGFQDVLHNSGQIRGAVVLGAGDDVILNTGSMAGRSLLGRGNDRYDGTGGGHEGSVEGEAGNDTLVGGTGDERLFGDAGSDLVIGGDGSDFISGGSGTDFLIGGTGVDVLSYEDSLLAVRVDVAAGTAATVTERDRFSEFEAVIGSRAADTLLGSTAGDVLDGFLGNDRLEGRAGDDTLSGDAGADTLIGGAGRDVFVFGTGGGTDLLQDFSEDDSIEIHGQEMDPLLLQQGADVLIGLRDGTSIVVRNTTVSAVHGSLHLSSATLHTDEHALDHDPLLIDTDLVVVEGAEFRLGDTVSRVSMETLPPSTALFLLGEASLWNSGTIAMATAGARATTRGIAVSGGAHTLANGANGLIDVGASGSDVVGVDGVYRVWNAGVIRVTSGAGDAIGIGDIDSNHSIFVNRGTLSVSAAGSAVGVRQGVHSTLGASGYVNSGVIEVHGGSASQGVDLSFNSLWEQSAFVNSGLIRVTDETETVDSIGLYLDSFGSRASLWNSGTIAADFAIRTTTGLTGEWSPLGLNVYNVGSISGLVYLSSWTDVVVNSGAMAGDVMLAGGNDTYDGRAGTLAGVLDGYDGDDTLLAGLGSDTVDGGFGNDLVSGGSGDDVLSGGAGRDRFRFETGDGNDVITDFEWGSDLIEVSGYESYRSVSQQGGGVLLVFSDTDSLLLRSSTIGAVLESLRFGAPTIAASLVPRAPDAPAMPGPSVTLYADASGDELTGLDGADRLFGGGSNDSLNGAAGTDSLFGGGGEDALSGHAGNDFMLGEAGRDLLVGGEADDFMAGGEDADALYGDAGNDTLFGDAGEDLLVGGLGADVLSGGPGDDTLGGDDEDDFLDSDDGNDLLLGHGGNDHMVAGSGIDALAGGGGDDEMAGGGDHDQLFGDEGNDRLFGDSGEDDLIGGVGDDVLSGGDADDMLGGGDGNDLLIGDAGNDVLYGEAGEDRLLGRGGRDLLAGGDAADQLAGGEDGDVIYGDGGNDQLFGEEGDDVLEGGTGDDDLLGGAGSDLFLVARGAGRDRIHDFEAGPGSSDRILFEGVFPDFDTLLSRSAQVGTDTVIAIDAANNITLVGVQLASLDRGDLQFA